MILTKGMPTKHNSAIYESAEVGNIDAACIITLRAAGALIFGKTTTTEFAAIAHNNNRKLFLVKLECGLSNESLESYEISMTPLSRDHVLWDLWKFGSGRESWI